MIRHLFKRIAHKKLYARFTLLLVSLLLGFALLAMLLTQIVVYYEAQKYIYDDIFMQQKEIDKSFTTILDETSYLFSRLVYASNTEKLYKLTDTSISQSDRYDIFLNVISPPLNQYYFKGVALIFSDEISYTYGIDEYPRLQYISNAASERITILGTDNNLLMLGRTLKNSNNDLSGVIIFYISERDLNAYINISDSQPNNESFIVSDNDVIWTHTRSEFAGRELGYADTLFDKSKTPYYEFKTVQGIRSAIIVSQATNMQNSYGITCYIVDIIDYANIYGQMYKLMWMLIMVTVITLALGLLVSGLLSRRLTRPIKHLNDSITSVINTGISIPTNANKGDEIYNLEKNYDEMIMRLFSLIQKNKDDMEILRKLELESLQMQINPHFLYNTLDAMSWLAKLKKQPEIARLAIHLGNFFRLVLHKGEKFISVSDEFDIVRNYIYIENVRFPATASDDTECDKFIVEYNIDESISNALTLKLILQPIVENAIKHGFELLKNNEVGIVKISAQASGDQIIYVVEDNGCGFENASDILFIDNAREKNGGYGLKNVDTRIKLEYGEEFGLRVESTPGIGTKVTAVIKRI
ncbi:MAG: histidine kinase [Christensenellaceae bacterium]|jgi:two-component system sensor histidine kinase YesM|nr:histidine kinase [Christensenellaceae bacterium]